MQETCVRSLGWEDPLEKEMATHSSILAWKISWAEEPDGLQSMRSQRVGHNWVTNTYLHLLPDSSVSKESTCNAGDPHWIPGSGRSAGEGVDYPLQYSWASLVAQLVENPPTMWDTWFLSLEWEDPLEKGKATHSSILACRILWTGFANRYMGLQRVGHNWVTFTIYFPAFGLKI